VLTGTCSISAVIGGGGGLTKSGTGTAILKNAMTYAGETAVSGGTLKLDYLPDGTVAYYAFNDAENLGLDGSSQTNTLIATGGGPVQRQRQVRRRALFGWRIQTRYGFWAVSVRRSYGGGALYGGGVHPCRDKLFVGRRLDRLWNNAGEPMQ